jgi:hypothetical protein
MQYIRNGWCWQLLTKFEPRDIWVGAYWKRYPCALEVYICVLPLLPIRVYVQWPFTNSGETVKDGA